VTVTDLPPDPSQTSDAAWFHDAVLRIRIAKGSSLSNAVGATRAH